MFVRALSRISNNLAQASLEFGRPMSFGKRLLLRTQSTNVNGNNNAKSFDFSLVDSHGKRLTGEEYLTNVRKLVENGEKDEWSLSAKSVISILKEYDNLLEEHADYKDKYQRALAEIENVRRRGAKSVDDAKTFAIQGFCKDLLEVADILDLAMSSVKKETLDQGGKELNDIYQGISMTKKVLLKTFEKHGVTPVDPMGTKFDPNLHEAIMQVPSSSVNVEAGHVAIVSKIGYSLKGRPIRAAQVGVAIE